VTLATERARTILSRSVLEPRQPARALIALAPVILASCVASAGPGSGQGGTAGSGSAAGAGGGAGRETGGSGGTTAAPGGRGGGGSSGSGGSSASGGTSGSSGTSGGSAASGGSAGSTGGGGSGGGGGNPGSDAPSGSDVGGGQGTGGTGGALPQPNAYSCDWGAPVFQRLAPSTASPGGLGVSNVPLLISIGFDDNAYEDGMRWILDFLKTRKNPGGNARPCTFDGTPARVTFFNNSHVGMNSEGIKAQHARAYVEGHEVANHTDTHDESLKQNPSKDVWLKEMSTCTDYHVGLGVPRAAIIGFRTPFLEQSNATFEAMLEQKFRYDCSIEHYYGVGGFVWPYSLENGRSPTHAFNVRPSGTYPGLWELPVYQLLTGKGDGAVTGFDYNYWILEKMTNQDALAAMKASLIVRMTGGTYPANRAPLLIGGHTDLYSNENNDANAMAVASVADRRAAIEEFIDFALSYNPAVRIVPYAEVLHWVQSPVGLDGTRGK
jgi:hypothetical protein